MKFWQGLFLMLVMTALCLPSQGSAAPMIYRATLDGPSESPPVASLGTGFAEIILDTAAHILSVSATFQDLSGSTTAAHIHGPTALPFTGNAGVITTTPSFPGFPLGVTSGSYFREFDTILATTWNPAFMTAHGGTPLDAEAAFAIFLAENRTYFNIHTNSYPAGEIRGFLVAPVPASLLLLGSGLAVLAGCRLRRRRS